MVMLSTFISIFQVVPVFKNIVTHLDLLEHVPLALLTRVAPEIMLPCVTLRCASELFFLGELATVHCSLTLDLFALCSISHAETYCKGFGDAVDGANSK